MNKVDEVIKEAMKEMINSYGSVEEVDRVTSWIETPASEYGSYCDTCGPDGPDVLINYVGVDGNEHYYVVYSTFGELIERLTA